MEDTLVVDQAQSRVFRGPSIIARGPEKHRKIFPGTPSAMYPRYKSIFPGFKIPAGSNAYLIRFIRASTSPEISFDM